MSSDTLDRMERVNVFTAIERVRDLLQDLERCEQHQATIRAQIRRNLQDLETELSRSAPLKGRFGGKPT